jgi:hypothetical protein
MRLCNNALSTSDYIVSKDGMINEQWIRMDVEESSQGLNEGPSLVFAWRDWGKPWKTLVRIANLWAKIWT